jgi:hypothetical protein
LDFVVIAAEEEGDRYGWEKISQGDREKKGSTKRLSELQEFQSIYQYRMKINEPRVGCLNHAHFQ